MSSGGFERSVYLSEQGNTHPIKVQPETLDLTLGGVTNAATSSTANISISARVGGSRKGVGLFARTVTVEFDEGSAPAGYEDEGKITLPWLESSTFGALAAGATGTYLGAPVTLIGKRPEVSR